MILEVDNDPRDAPYSSFFCDPARPTYSGPLPHGHRRFRLMLLTGERDEDVPSESGLRRLLSPLVPSYDDLHLLRADVYRHQARQAERFVNGRVALVGDAAHLMPPWAGQGLNSGIRDATNLAWKLALLVREQAGPHVLDTYHAERAGHVRQVIDLSRRFGKVFIPRQTGKVVARDVVMRAVRKVPAAREALTPRWFSTPLRYTDGALVHRPDGHQDRRVGMMFVQPEVETDAGPRRLDDVLGPWFAAVSYRCDATDLLGDEAQACWDGLGARFVRVELSRSPRTDESGAERAEDTYGSLEGWFAGAEVAVIRPDRVVAAVTTRQGLDQVTRDLARQLGTAATSQALRVSG